MKLGDKLKKVNPVQVWDEFCGYLDLGLKNYMYIQKRLMQEQIDLWSASGLGKSLLKGKTPKTIDEFRQALPLTTYEDYAEILLKKRTDMLPREPMIWIQTTWEGGLRPIKLAPYTREMLDIYRHNVETIMMLASSTGKYKYTMREKDSILYGGAPLPYATGLMPSLLSEDISFVWLPDSNEHSDLSFSQRIKKGFELAYKYDIDYFFAIGSVANYITDSFGKKGAGVKTGLKISPRIAARYIRAKYLCKRDGRTLQPKDVFKLKGFIGAGTDSRCYKKKLGDAWGVTPIEIAAGTESTCIGVETWERRGMVLFPDACFYEFIPEDEMYKNLQDPSYMPKTCLMDEVSKDRNYELVITVFKGGAFARYRIGDVYRCVSAGGKDEIPTFTFIDRIPTIIDIAGFTRITRRSVEEVIARSKLGIGRWFARKEYTDGNCPFIHMYLEMKPDAAESDAISKKILTEHLSVYFKSFDSDYEDLKKLLEIDPLQIQILKYGTIARYERLSGTELQRINPPDINVISLLRMESDASVQDSGEGRRR